MVLREEAGREHPSQIKDDLGYLQLDRASECSATLAVDARAPHVVPCEPAATIQS